VSVLFGFEAYSPKEIALRVENIGVAKARLPLLPMFLLGILAGAFIGLGALCFVLVKSDLALSFAVSQLLGGLVFSLGLILVVVAGAELFTGNNLLAIAWVDNKISSRELLKNWLVVCVANFVGAVGLAFLVFFSGHTDMNNGEIAQQYLTIAASKTNLSFGTAFFKGVLCNILVCMAVWMAVAGRTVVDKVVVIIFPITAFVAAGFEHSIANMYLIPMGMLIEAFSGLESTPNGLGIVGLLKNLLPVILGNILGGSGFVALVYHVIYRGGAANHKESP
jgi:formate transporter